MFYLCTSNGTVFGTPTLAVDGISPQAGGTWPQGVFDLGRTGIPGLEGKPFSKTSIVRVYPSGEPILGVCVFLRGVKWVEFMRTWQAYHVSLSLGQSAKNGTWTYQSTVIWLVLCRNPFQEYGSGIRDHHPSSRKKNQSQKPQMQVSSNANCWNSETKKYRTPLSFVLENFNESVSIPPSDSPNDGGRTSWTARNSTQRGPGMAQMVGPFANRRR